MQIGTGSTDALLDAYKIGMIGGENAKWNWFAQGNWQHSVLVHQNYRPGYADIEFPFYQNVSGNQLVPSRIYKLILGYNF